VRIKKQATERVIFKIWGEKGTKQTLVGDPRKERASFNDVAFRSLKRKKKGSFKGLRGVGRFSLRTSKSKGDAEKKKKPAQPWAGRW